MRTFCIAALCAVFLAWGVPGTAAAKPFPQLLPPPSDFELTVREDPGSKLPLGASCGGEAGLTLACRAFVVTLRNLGKKTVHLSRIGCQEPVVTFERKEPNSSNGWWPISQVARPNCSPWTYENLRLRPGESTKYTTRLVAPNRAPDFAPVTPGSYAVRVHWLLWGCTEDPEGTDCMAPLQIMKTASWGPPPIGDVEIQTPVEVISREIEVSSPALPDLGPLKLSIEASVVPDSLTWIPKYSPRSACLPNPNASVECTVFRLTIRNDGERPIRMGRFSCSDSSILPQYRRADGTWTEVQQKFWNCTANVFFETPILPGKTLEREFLLSYLTPGFDTTGLYPAGDYGFRFQFTSSACVAAPDGSFSLQCPTKQPTIVSNEIVVHATEFVPPPKAEPHDSRP